MYKHHTYLIFIVFLLQMLLIHQVIRVLLVQEKRLTFSNKNYSNIQRDEKCRGLIDEFSNLSAHSIIY